MCLHSESDGQTLYGPECAKVRGSLFVWRNAVVVGERISRRREGADFRRLLSIEVLHGIIIEFHGGVRNL